ncbi:MAG: sulfotransferase [Rhodospirillales bacterium]|nr:sulfotransferase [Rhodospirillales bacterium]
MTENSHDFDPRISDFRKDESFEKYLHSLNLHLAKFNLPKGVDGSQFPLIYVVGLPRSGTTLLSQLLSRYFEVGYVNNLIARFWLNPVVGIKLSQEILGSNARKRIQFKSIHGVTREPWGPHEFGYFWRHWLQLDQSETHKLSQEVLEKVDQDRLRITLDSMTSAFEAPVVFKNVICGFQADFLSKLRPNSVFVLIERDPKDVANSLFRCRIDRYGDPAVWWSLKPSNFNEIKSIRSPKEQIKLQISGCEKDFKDELSKESVSCIRVNYEDLCADPEKNLRKIADFVTTLGYRIDLTDKHLSL